MSSGRAAGQGNRGAKAAVTAPQREPLLDGGMRDDLIGICLVAIGIVLFVAVVMPGDAFLSSRISWCLRHAFGIGAFIVPFAFVIWGAAYFLKAPDTKAWRIIAGVCLILVALMSLLSLFSPAADETVPGTLFGETCVVDGGGYLGSGISWALLSLFGRIIACIVLIAVIICGLVLVGVSVSTPFLFLKYFIFQKGTDDDEDLGFDESRAASRKTRKMDAGEAGQGQTEDIRGKTARSGLEDAPEQPSADDATNSARAGQDPAATLAIDPATAMTSKIARKKKGAKASKPAQGSSRAATSGPTALEGFVLPDPRVLRVSGPKRAAAAGELRQTAGRLQQTLEEFNLPAEVVGWLAGPTVTMFKVDLARGVKLSRLVNLSDDIALALAASAVRIAQIPGTSLVGVEVPNKKRESVLLGDVITEAGPGPLQLAIGEDVDGDKICVDLAKMPHLLIGGTTGSGKSITLNSMIMTILMRATPAEVRMILIDPKRVEFSLYNGIPHLFVPPVTEPKEAASALKWGVAEMERRLKLFEQVGARNIGLYNQMIQKGELTDDNGDHPAELPFIVIVIDELSDLMMVAGKDVEDSIVRISQLARAAGIHLIVATQRPSANVVTGMIKANITNRVAMTVATAVESRVILDSSGAEKLVGNGDMLFSKPEWGKPRRIQGCYVGEAEIQSVVAHLKEQGQPEYNLDILHQAVSSGPGGAGGGATGAGGGDGDPLLWDAAEAVVTAQLGSTSMLQRRLKVGYARAGRIMDQLAEKGVVGPANGSRAREVLVEDLNELESLRALDEQDEDDEE